MQNSADDCLQSALEDGDLGVVLLALRRIAEACGGMAKLAQATGLTREALYRTLSGTGNPRLTCLAAILNATSLRLTIVPAEHDRRCQNQPFRSHSTGDVG
jgi:probable addiction module antidote protein